MANFSFSLSHSSVIAITWWRLCIAHSLTWKLCFSFFFLLLNFYQAQDHLIPVSSWFTRHISATDASGNVGCTLLCRSCRASASGRLQMLLISWLLVFWQTKMAVVGLIWEWIRSRAETGVQFLFVHFSSDWEEASTACGCVWFDEQLCLYVAVNLLWCNQLSCPFVVLSTS